MKNYKKLFLIAICSIQIVQNSCTTPKKPHWTEANMLHMKGGVAGAIVGAIVSLFITDVMPENDLNDAIVTLGTVGGAIAGEVIYRNTEEGRMVCIHEIEERRSKAKSKYVKMQQKKQKRQQRKQKIS